MEIDVTGGKKRGKRNYALLHFYFFDKKCSGEGLGHLNESGFGNYFEKGN